MKEALEKVEKMGSDLGGTEILQPLKHIYNQACIPKHPRQVNNDVWATVLALIWLYGFKMDAMEEWELLTMKAASWIKSQTAPSVSECAEAGNTLLGCSLKKEALGL